MSATFDLTARVDKVEVIGIVLVRGMIRKGYGCPTEPRFRNRPLSYSKRCLTIIHV